MNDFADTEGIEDAEIHDEMTEADAFSAYELAFALGLGEEIGLEDAANYESMRLSEEEQTQPEEQPVINKEPISIKAAKGKKNSSFSSLTGKPKCPFEQWVKDICAGRKCVSDPIGGDNSYGDEKEYDLFAG